MQPSLEKLRKFFELEREKEYENKAIIGGLARMLDYWEGEARTDNIKEEIIQAVVQRLRAYDGLSPAGRAEALNGLWKRITDNYPEAGQGQSASQQPPRSQSAPQPRPSSPPRSSPPPPDSNRRPSTPPPPPPRPRPVTPPRSDSVPGARHSQTPAALSAPLTVLQGIGPKHAATLETLGLHTLGDLLYYYPRRYDDYSQLKPIKSLWYGEQVTVIGAIQSVYSRPIQGGSRSLLEVVLGDGTGNLRLTWFNQPWLANRLREGMQISVSGRIEQRLGRLVMQQPDWEPVEAEHLHTNRIVPIYPLTGHITQKWLRGIINQVVGFWAPAVVDPLPEEVRTAAQLMPLGNALLQVHFPESHHMLQTARARLAFDEIFFLQMGVLRQKRDWKQVEGRRFPITDEWLQSQLSRLPFTLTAAQSRAVTEIRSDLNSGQPMNRLLQGDVGSGKTVVAALAAAMVTSGGSQAAIMAPTGILAEQHYTTFTTLLANGEGGMRPEAIRLLVGDTPEAEKDAIRSGLADGSIQIVIGTHAVIEQPVQFKDLQLAVIDEQHRFGVEQRAELRSKGTNPHLLVMTATPIPRSLALTIYGDLDLSVIEEMPA
ncbi:MAG TPA: DEAD/DEAH box helicase, partial [Anaerolineales bacterium]|nr:DEAD/DEAH box helicase [Anaerolineales bacterium]